MQYLFTPLARTCFVTLLSLSAPVMATNLNVTHPVEAALNADDAKSLLDPSIKLYFGKNTPANIQERMGTFSSNQKANAFGRAEEVACQRAFLNSMLQLQKRAKSLGANAISNITSYYRRAEFSSETEYECHAGGLVVSVAFKADFVKTGE